MTRDRLANKKLRNQLVILRTRFGTTIITSRHRQPPTPRHQDNNNKKLASSLVVGFPNRTHYLRSSISYLILLSVLFTLTIILSFYFTVLNSIKQKNISEMKTDFINNMTHEFKTPIATIGLACEALKDKNISLNMKIYFPFSYLG